MILLGKTNLPPFRPLSKHDKTKTNVFSERKINIYYQVLINISPGKKRLIFTTKNSSSTFCASSLQRKKKKNFDRQFHKSTLFCSIKESRHESRILILLWLKVIPPKWARTTSEQQTLWSVRLTHLIGLLIYIYASTLMLPGEINISQLQGKIEFNTFSFENLITDT